MNRRAAYDPWATRAVVGLPEPVRSGGSRGATVPWVGTPMSPTSRAALLGVLRLGDSPCRQGKTNSTRLRWSSPDTWSAERSRPAVYEVHVLLRIRLHESPNSFGAGVLNTLRLNVRIDGEKMGLPPLLVCEAEYLNKKVQSGLLARAKMLTRSRWFSPTVRAEMAHRRVDALAQPFAADRRLRRARCLNDTGLPAGPWATSDEDENPGAPN